MQVDNYIKMYLVNDIVLAITLIITSYTWYLLISGKVTTEEESRDNAIAEVVIPAQANTKVNRS